MDEPSVNPYGVSDSSRFEPETDKSARPQYKLYSVGSIVLAGFLGTFAGAGATMAINYMRLNRFSAAWITMIVAVVATALVLTLAFVLPESVPSSAYLLPQLLVIYFVAEGLQAKLIKEHGKQLGRKASAWGAAGIGLLACVCVLSTVFVVVWFLPHPLDSPVIYLNDNDEIYYSGDATAADARRLGAILTDYGFLGHQGVTVLLSKDEAFTVAIVFNEGAWDDSDTVDSVQSIGETIADEGFGRPLFVEMVNELIEVQRTLTIEESSGDDSLDY